MSLIQEGPEKRVRMADLAHRRLAQHQRSRRDSLPPAAATVVRDLAECFPKRFDDQTNGVTPPRWYCSPSPTCRA